MISLTWENHETVWEKGIILSTTDQRSTGLAASDEMVVEVVSRSF